MALQYIRGYSRSDNKPATISNHEKEEIPPYPKEMRKKDHQREMRSCLNDSDGPRLVP
jgi:hypothetical protein